MECPECIKNDRTNDTKKIEAAKERGRKEAKQLGLTAFCIIKTVNSNPGYRWVAYGDESIQRRGGIVEHCIVY